MPKGELANRLIVAAVGLPIAVLIIYLGGWYLGILMAIASGISASEYYSLAVMRGSKPLSWIGIPVAVSLPLIATLYPNYYDFVSLAFGFVIGATLLALIMVIWIRWPEDQPLTAVAITISGALYTGGTLSFWILLRALPEQGSDTATAFHGAILLIFPIWVTWIGDSFAYGIGTLFGKSKLMESVSPNKTIIGSFGGILGSMIVGALYAWLWLSDVPVYGLSIIGAVVLSLFIAVIGQLGDLAESVLKREVGVKDSSNLLPGHGGALDRLDSLYFTIPFTYSLMVLMQSWL